MRDNWLIGFDKVDWLVVSSGGRKVKDLRGSKVRVGLGIG
jgi:hypothetical protein